MQKLMGLAAGAALLLGFGSPAAAGSSDGYKGYYSYAVKVVCGYYGDYEFDEFSDENGPYPAVADGGYYYTAVNVTNPNNSKVEYEYTFVPLHDWPFDDKYSGKSGSFNAYTGAEYDCGKLFGGEKYGYDSKERPPFYKGILYIWAKKRLDVWGVYTAKYPKYPEDSDDSGDSNGGDFEQEYQHSIDMEQVWGRYLSRKSGTASDLED